MLCYYTNKIRNIEFLFFNSLELFVFKRTKILACNWILQVLPYSFFEQLYTTHEFIKKERYQTYLPLVFSFITNLIKNSNN